ncbi:MAG: hypothetical protein ABL931_05655 [Usitatibacteraceae bacterium]
MLIAESKEEFQDFLAERHKVPDRLLPEDLLIHGFAFYELTRATDALPADDASCGDGLLFQWGTRDALAGYYGECYYFDLTRQFISQVGEDDDAMFQLTCQLQYELSPELRAIATGNRWCWGVESLPEFKEFALNHPALSVVAGRPAAKIEFYLTPV